MNFTYSSLKDTLEIVPYWLKICSITCNRIKKKKKEDENLKSYMKGTK